MKRLFFVCAACLIATSAGFNAANADTVTMTGSDGFGSSSFNTSGQWDNGLAPSAGNDYIVGAGIRMRLPATGGSYTFAGDSLTISDGNPFGSLNGFAFKGSGGSTITVSNLILDNGSINHIDGFGDLFTLDGNVNVVGDSFMYAKQGSIDVVANVSGSATITNPGADGAGRTLTFLSSGNTFNGTLVNEGNFVLADDAVMNFTVGASGVNNALSGAGATVLDGDFVLDLSGASATEGDSWSLVTNTATTYGATFNLVGFTESADVWTSGVYSFSESTGVLSVVSAVPEPGSLAVLAMISMVAGLRRRKSIA